MGAYPTPVTPTLLQIATDDFINYKGVDYAIESVVSVTNHGLGQLTAVITFDDGNDNDIQLTLTNADTVVDHTDIDQGGTAHTYWVQTINP